MAKVIDNKIKAKVRSSYALTNSYIATANEVGISDHTVKKIIEENPEEYTRIYEKKKESFAEQAQSIIDKALKLLHKRYDKALENEAELEELIDIIYHAKDPENDDELSNKEKLEIARKIGRLELNNLAEITTSMGTIYDKMRLDKGQSTGNIKVSYEDSLKAVSGEDDY